MEIPVTTAHVALWIKETPTDRGYWRHNAQELVNSRQWGRTSLVAEQWTEYVWPQNIDRWTTGKPRCDWRPVSASSSAES
jgi:hypothetical protein